MPLAKLLAGGVQTRLPLFALMAVAKDLSLDILADIDGVLPMA